jgi:hypothetical protein
MSSAEELLLDSKAIYPETYVYIVQTEKDSISLKNPTYAINTNNYSGLKKGLWINVAGMGKSINELEKYKSKYPGGYVKKLGQYRKTSSLDRDSIPVIKSDWVVQLKDVLISDSLFSKNDELFHLISFRNLKGKVLSNDTFSISSESEISTVSTYLYSCRTCPLIIERYFSSAQTGSTYEIRTFETLGKKWCAMEQFTNDGGPEDESQALIFNSNDQPVIVVTVNDEIQSQKTLTCNKK